MHEHRHGAKVVRINPPQQHTNTAKINHVFCSGGNLAKVVSFAVVVFWNVAYINTAANTTNTNTNTRKQTAKVAYY